MKKWPVILLLLSVTVLGCNKNNSNKCSTPLTIVKTPAPCVTFGIEINGSTYYAEDLPAEFQVENLKVCATYELTSDPVSCTCCGDKARIISISRYND